MAVFPSFIKETTSTTGTGAITLSGAVPGFAAFSASSLITNGTTVYYAIKSGNNREEGIGTWGTGNILTRTTVLTTLVAGVLDDTSPTAISLTGTSVVFISLSARTINDIFAAPPAIGNTTPAAATFTTLTVNTNLVVSKTITAPATVGAQTINKTAGSVNFASALAPPYSLEVTNSLVTTNSVIIATVATNDATMLSVQAVAGSGIFTLYANAAAAAETRVNFIVVN